MQEENEEIFNLNFFRELKFNRIKCNNCGNFFWTKDFERKTCGDPPCDQYSFINNPAGKKPLSVSEVRELFLTFFGEDHKRLNSYPVVPRWRSDVLLVNASIYVFQPHVTSGIVKPPGNPIVMSQPSIRMNDLDLVGTSGRHLTTFEMMCHDSFNYNGKEIYWKDGTVSRCYNFFTLAVGIEGKEITYKEKPWSGGGNAGNALEVFIRGVEVGTLVFMNLTESQNGNVVVDGKKYREMDLRIVDTGYGLERISWLTKGSASVYESTFPEVLDLLLFKSGINSVERDEMGIISKIYSRDPNEPVEEIEREVKDATKESDVLDWNKVELIRQAYILGDHTRSILHMSRDYVMPSNVKVGYLMRMLMRRSFRAMEFLNLDVDILDIIDMHLNSLRSIISDYPKEFLREILKDEKVKYERSMKEGKDIIEKMIKRKKNIDIEDLIVLYDSYGIIPEYAQKIAWSSGVRINIPMNLHELIVNRHETEEDSKETNSTPSSLEGLETRPLYYDDVKMKEFTAIVLGSESNLIVPNQTAFYPTGGGQPHDTGYFELGRKKLNVSNVYKSGNAIIHELDGNLEKGSRIKGYVDQFRRHRLMLHHSATHLMVGVLRKVLGEQVWQAGAQKGVDTSRLDFTYNRKITREDIENIEHALLQEIVLNRKISVRHVDWNEAIKKYGSRLFEGGAPLSKKLRIVEIEGLDVEGCGGTHLSSTGEIGFIKIVSMESVQENIYRVVFAAGDAALDIVEKTWNEMIEIKKEVRSTENTLSKVKSTVDEMISLRKRLGDLHKEIAEEKIKSAKPIIESNFEYIQLNLSDSDMIKLAIPAILSMGKNAIISGKGNKTIVSRDNDVLSFLYHKLTNQELSQRGPVVSLSLKDMIS